MADLIAQQQALDAVGRALAALFPAGAESLVLRTAQLRAVTSRTIVAYYPDGRWESLRVRDDNLSDAVRDLRDVMYEPGAGTWFSAVFTVTADGRMASTFDYDNEPD